ISSSSFDFKYSHVVPGLEQTKKCSDEYLCLGEKEARCRAAPPSDARLPACQINALIFALRVAIQVPKSQARVAEPATTPVATATRTKAYSTKSWPDSSRWNLLMNCRNVMHPLF